MYITIEQIQKTIHLQYNGIVISDCKNIVKSYLEQVFKYLEIVLNYYTFN